jgi:CDP-archaeol synthase
MVILKLLFLLAVANTAPLIAKRWMGTFWARPLDAGMRFVDGRPVLGPSKTVRGFVAALIAATLGALLLGFPPVFGVLIGGGAMLGDMLSSFIKRRLNVAPSGRATGLDQIPEALVPLLAVQSVLHLSVAQIAGITTVFLACEIPLAWLFHRFGWRDQPY